MGKPGLPSCKTAYSLFLERRNDKFSKMGPLSLVPLHCLKQFLYRPQYLEYEATRGRAHPFVLVHFMVVSVQWMVFLQTPFAVAYMGYVMMSIS